jgi:hypothetical protein
MTSLRPPREHLSGAQTGDDVTRRSLLQRLLLLISISCGRLVYRPVRAAADPESDAGMLSGAEVEDLLAFGETLVKGSTLSHAERQYLVEHIEDRAKRSPEYLSLYRTAVNTLNRLTGRRVSTLDIGERRQLVERHRLGVSLIRPGEDLGVLPEEMRALRKRVTPDLIAGYYGSASGWAVVGYSTFPGRCGALTRYVGSAT